MESRRKRITTTMMVMKMFSNKMIMMKKLILQRCNISNTFKIAQSLGGSSARGALIFTPMLPNYTSIALKASNGCMYNVHALRLAAIGKKKVKGRSACLTSMQEGQS